MPAAPRPPVVSAVHIGLAICTAGVLLSFPISVGPAFTAIAEEQGVELTALTRLLFSPAFGVPVALLPAGLLVRLAVVIGVGASVLALMGLTELFFPPGAGGARS